MVKYARGPGQVFRKHAHLVLSAGNDLHRAAATRTEPHSSWHLRGTIRTTLNGSLGLVHCGHLTKKLEQATNEWNQPSALTRAAPDSKFVQIVSTQWRFVVSSLIGEEHGCVPAVWIFQCR